METAVERKKYILFMINVQWK